MQSGEGKFDNPDARWAGVGPYYAMFPTRFADRVIESFSAEGDTILDPFSGRGTSLFSAATRGRHALGVEINPVGWVYSATKLSPAARWRVEDRVEQLGRLVSRYRHTAKRLPPFFRACFALDVRAFLLAARTHLDWRGSAVDRTLMSILLIDLHGKRTLALSNQMRQTKAMSPLYAIRWWKEKNLSPPERDPVPFILRKIAWRYAKGIPNTTESKVYLGDCTHALPWLSSAVGRLAPKGARLLLTSPPYFGITNYHYDQWLRLWLLGGPPNPSQFQGNHRGKFTHPIHYRAMLLSAFSNASKLLAEDATIYVRTDHRKTTASVTLDVLREVFPKHCVKRRLRPVRGVTQTMLFGNPSPKIGEIDYLLMRR